MLSQIARKLGSWVRIPLEAWTSVHVFCSDRGPEMRCFLVQGIIPKCLKEFIALEVTFEWGQATGCNL